MDAEIYMGKKLYTRSCGDGQIFMMIHGEKLFELFHHLRGER